MHTTLALALLPVLVSAVHAQSYCDPGFALDFDGADDRVMVPYDASFPTEVFTVSAWIKTTSTMGRSAIIARGEDDNSWNLSWQLYVNPAGDLEIMLEDVNERNFCYPLNSCFPMGSCTSGDLFVADGTWHHVAATRDAAGALSVYVDGQERGSCTGTGVPSANNFHDLSIGCTFGTIGPPPGGVEPPVWFFPGWIDEPAMWNVALSAAQVQDVFANGVDPASPGLMGFWRMDEATGQVVADASPAGNDGYHGAVPTADGADPLWVTEPPVAVNYCVALPNSTGATASIGATGSLSITANTFALTVQGATPNQFGYFFYGPEQAQSPLGDGFLCVGAGALGLFRLVPAVLVDGTGGLTRAVDFEQPPANAGAGAILPGSTWNFQMWHRDSTAGGGTGSNLTDGMSVLFCP